MAYQIDFMVNGVRTSEVFDTFSFYDAQKLLKARYPGSDLRIMFWKEVKR